MASLPVPRRCMISSSFPSSGPSHMRRRVWQYKPDPWAQKPEPKCCSEIHSSVEANLYSYTSQSFSRPKDSGLCHQALVSCERVGSGHKAIWYKLADLYISSGSLSSVVTGRSSRDWLRRSEGGLAGRGSGRRGSGRWMCSREEERPWSVCIWGRRN